MSIRVLSTLHERGLGRARHLIASTDNGDGKSSGNNCPKIETRGVPSGEIGTWHVSVEVG